VFFCKNKKKSSSNRLGVQVELVFQLTQHLRDEKLINSLISYFGCGKMYKKSNVEAVDYKISKFSDLTEKLIPFFYKHKIIGVKYKDFNDFCLVANLMKNKAHLTSEGLEEIIKIKNGMNKGRK